MHVGEGTLFAVHAFAQVGAVEPQRIPGEDDGVRDVGRHGGKGELGLRHVALSGGEAGIECRQRGSGNEEQQGVKRSAE